MTRGRTDLRFHGGPFDGSTYPDMPTMHARDQIRHAFNAHAAWIKSDNQISIYNSSSHNRHKNWFVTAISEYRKRPASSGGVDYDFVRSRVVGRCLALTKKGEQCRNEAQEGSVLCETSHKTSNSDVQLINDEFLQEELRYIAESEAPDTLDILLLYQNKK